MTQLGESSLKHKSLQHNKDPDWNSNPHRVNGDGVCRDNCSFSVDPEVTPEVQQD